MSYPKKNMLMIFEHFISGEMSWHTFATNYEGLMEEIPPDTGTSEENEVLDGFLGIAVGIFDDSNTIPMEERHKVVLEESKVVFGKLQEMWDGESQEENK